MAAKIYSGIKGIEAPKMNFRNFNAKEYNKECENYIFRLNAACKANSPNSKDKDIGEVISFPVADGKAQYMVFSIKPLVLIHINLMDGYQEEMAGLLTVKKTRELVQRQRALAELFSKKK